MRNIFKLWFYGCRQFDYMSVFYEKNRKHRADEFLKVKPDFDGFFLQRGDYFPIPLIKAMNVPLFWGLAN